MLFASCDFKGRPSLDSRVGNGINSESLVLRLPYLAVDQHVLLLPSFPPMNQLPSADKTFLISLPLFFLPYDSLSHRLQQLTLLSALLSLLMTNLPPDTRTRVSSQGHHRPVITSTSEQVSFISDVMTDTYSRQDQRLKTRFNDGAINGVRRQSNRDYRIICADRAENR